MLQNSHSDLYVTPKGEIVDSIESNVETSAIRVNEGTDQLMQAERYQVSYQALFCDTFYFVFFCLEQSTEKEDDFNGCRCSYFIDYYHRHCARSQKLDVSCNQLNTSLPSPETFLKSALSGFTNDNEILTEAKYFQIMARKKKLYLASILVGVLVALGLIIWLSH